MSDKDLLKRRFAANLRSYNSLAVVQETICAELFEMADRLVAEPVRMGLEIGTGTGFLTRLLLDCYPDAAWTLNDLVEESQCYLHPYTANRDVRYLWGDAETLLNDNRAAAPSVGKKFDLIATASTVQWFDDQPSFLTRAAGLLRTGGMLACSTFGQGNFQEIKATTGDGLNYYTSEEVQELMRQAGLKISETKEYTRQLVFATPTDVLRHIKATGVNAIHKPHWTKRRLTAFEEQYRGQFSTPDGMVTLTYHPILIVAKKGDY